ncbi:MAG: hypothetical protein JW866_06300 [Ignavibacteriales bacterium]|nr:hypothetical protein [Ignavibacteriales bacterium]
MKIWGIIGIIAALVTIFVFFTGFENINQFFISVKSFFHRNLIVKMPNQIIEDHIGIKGAIIGQSTKEEILQNFGKEYEEIIHNKYSVEMNYSDLGISFFYGYKDPFKTIFSIRLEYPFQGETLRGIKLGESRAQEVIDKYGQKNWTTSQSGNTWYLSYPGIEFHVEKDGTLPTDLNFDAIYLHKLIKVIVIK